MVKQKNWRLYYTPVSSHLKRFDNRMKIGLCTGENVPDPVLTTASARRVFISLLRLSGSIGTGGLQCGED